MADFAVSSQPYNRVCVTSSSFESIGVERMMNLAGSAAASATWTLANRAIYIPVVIYQPFALAKIAVINGGAVSGNIDVGVYDDQGDRIASAGSTAQAGISAIQSFAVSATLLPGPYYIGVAMDNVTGALSSDTLTNVIWASAAGVLQQASAFPLPATATFAQATTAVAPVVTMLARSVV